eukprot:1256162-Amphidinium_carterae.1
MSSYIQCVVLGDNGHEIQPEVDCCRLERPEVGQLPLHHITDVSMIALSTYPAIPNERAKPM